MTETTSLAIPRPYHRDAREEPAPPRAETPVGAGAGMPDPGPEQPRDPRDDDAAGRLPSASEALLARLGDEGSEERNRFRWIVAGVAIFHAILLFITFPELTDREIYDVGKPGKVFVMEQPRYKKPPAPPAKQQQPIPKTKAKKIPIPDPTPDEPEPIETELPVVPEIEFADVTEVTFGIPDAPPMDGTGLSGPQDYTGEAMELGSGVVRPVYISKPQPLYTEEARQARIQGVVILQGIVDTQGNVRNLKIVKGLPLGLAESALEMVATWRFKPATYQGRAVAVRMHFTVNFTVQ